METKSTVNPVILARRIAAKLLLQVARKLVPPEYEEARKHREIEKAEHEHRLELLKTAVSLVRRTSQLIEKHSGDHLVPSVYRASIRSPEHDARELWLDCDKWLLEGQQQAALRFAQILAEAAKTADGET